MSAFAVAVIDAEEELSSGYRMKDPPGSECASQPHETGTSRVPSAELWREW